MKTNEIIKRKFEILVTNKTYFEKWSYQLR